MKSNMSKWLRANYGEHEFSNLLAAAGDVLLGRGMEKQRLGAAVRMVAAIYAAEACVGAPDIHWPLEDVIRDVVAVEQDLPQEEVEAFEHYCEAA